MKSIDVVVWFLNDFVLEIDDYTWRPISSMPCQDLDELWINSACSCRKYLAVVFGDFRPVATYVKLLSFEKLSLYIGF